MNEIEEYLLMIFLEDLNCLTEDGFRRVVEHDGNARSMWSKFKQEELGRTIPEEFEFYVTDLVLNHIKGQVNAFALTVLSHKFKSFKNKIKITVVEDD